MNSKNHGVFVSETELYEDIIKNFDKECLPLECNSIFMDEEDLKLLVCNLKNKITTESKQIVKKAIGTIEGHLNSAMYSNLNEKEWKDSAVICELFRNYFISKNSSTLNTIELQIKIFNAIRNKNLKFYIAWGHAKRSCGGLKTDSYYSDFSEIYSISMLSTLMNAIGYILNKKVELTVYSGSDRFYPALFTNKKYSDEYDSQRNFISAILEPEYAAINFKKYPQSEDKRSHFEQNQVGMEDIESHYNTILLNIDWKNILENNISPHKIKIPKSFSTIKLNVEEIIILAITSILNEKNQSIWIEKLGNITIFNEIIDFFHNVCLISTKKYLSIHLQKIKKISYLQIA
ncbi:MULTISPECIES: hypothetical protein [unclassified Pasteurella]|uniref:hypothetical protein n=1 Tax=unclassified Pasteurella TaxID=2621516 RepID=UPI001073257E|nr:hypothetical protein [Pasteurella sp. 19428wF3_WM03]TFU49803.1 hypothetical protein E4T92_10140 [Pasteurella sp. WM03]